MKQFALTGLISLLVLSGLALAGQSVEKQKQSEMQRGIMDQKATEACKD
jgi:hypothetical protein